MTATLQTKISHKSCYDLSGMLTCLQPPSKTLLPWRTLLLQPQQTLSKSKVPNGANTTMLPL